MTWADSEGAVLARLRAWPDLVTLIPKASNPAQARAFMGIPVPSTETDFPLVTVPGWVGGGQADGQAPLDAPLIQVDVWGGFHAQSPNGTRNPNKAGLFPVLSAVRDALDIQSRVEVSTSNGVVRLWSELETGFWFPDPDDGRPRYALTFAVTAVAVT